VSSLGNIFVFYKTRHILLSNSANCTMLHAIVLTQYRRVTDGQTDRHRIAIASTPLAMPALRRAVKKRRCSVLRRNGPVLKSMESVLRLEASLSWERFVKEVGLEAGVKERGRE